MQMDNSFIKIKSILGNTFNRKTKLAEKDEDSTDIDSELDAIEKGGSPDDASGDASGDAEDGADASGDNADGEDGAEDKSGEDAVDGDAPDMGGSGGSDSMGGGFGGGSDGPSDDSGDEDKPEADDTDNKQNDAPEDDAFAGQSDEQKVDSMFTDTGNIDFDYSLSNENNVRLAKFKFKKSNVDYDSMMTELEKKTGVPSDEIEMRMAADQKIIYRKSNVELRKKYPKIDAREKNLIIYNSDVPFVKKDSTGIDIPLEDDEIQDAYKKINQYMIKRYGRYWQDKKEAINFITSIKVNFSSKKSIRPNLSYAKDLFPESEDVSSLPFDRITIKIPSDVDEFLRNNLENEKFKKSSVFRTVAAVYLNQNSKSNGVYAIILPDEEVPDEADSGVDDTEEDAPAEDEVDVSADDNIDELEADMDDEGTSDNQDDETIEI